MTIFLGKFGGGVFSDPGADPTVAYGPIPSVGTTGTGIPYPPYRLGSIVNGSEGSEFVFTKLILASATDMLPGEFYTYDRNYLAVKLATATSILNQEVGVALFFANQLAAGTYFVWLGRAGHLPVRAAAASLATGFGETTATAGVAKFPATPTVTAYSINPSSVYVASAGVTFTGNITNGSPTITNVSAASVADLALGQSIAGTGIPANANICAIRTAGGTYQLDIGTSTAAALTTLQNATATTLNLVITPTLTLPGNVYWPTLNKLN
jgi:hypothetical protein